VARVVLGTGLEATGEREVPGVTLGAVLDRLADEEPWLREADVRAYVGGVDADRLEGEDTPVGDEDTVLLAPA
jgi:molybdopterin converting factor small subunit